MKHEPFLIAFERHAREELDALPRAHRAEILDAIQRYLSTAPYQPIKTRVKRLGHLTPTLYRLRVGDFRVYYRIHQRRVVILAVLHKKETKRWLT